MPIAIGTSIVGRPSWATTAPSTNSTIEWISCCGCTTTSIRSKGTSKSRCASITSSPLLTRVAELVVITLPIAKLGWASACSGVTAASSARDRPRNGPPLAVSTRRRTSSAEPARRLWAIALCSESTGTIWPGRARSRTSGPPMMSDSLLASASVVPASSAASVGRSPTAPVMPLRTTSQAIAAASVEASSPRPEYAGANSATCCSKRSGLRPAGGEPDHPEAVGVGAHEVEGLGADRPGGAEDDDVAAAGHRRLPRGVVGPEGEPADDSSRTAPGGTGTSSAPSAARTGSSASPSRASTASPGTSAQPAGIGATRRASPSPRTAPCCRRR